MLVPRFTQERCLILSDADVESTLAAAMASEQQSISNADPSTLIPAWWDRESGENLDLIISAVEPAIKRHADLYALNARPELHCYPPEGDHTEDLPVAIHCTHMLTTAAYQAIELGLRRVIWPLRIPEDHPDRINHIGTALDRAMLISRLVSLDAAAETSPEVQIETPFIDLTDIQILDLARDMALPLETCWWAQAQSIPSAQHRAQRWQQVDQRQAVQLEPKPGVQTHT